MRSQPRYWKPTVFSGLLLAFLLLAATQASAEWRLTHGHSGHIEYKDRITNTDYTFPATRYEYGWGLDFRMGYGKFNWVHFAVPTRGDSTYGARYVRLKLYKGDSLYTEVDQVDVFNGSTRVKTFTLTDQAWSGWKTLTLDLGSVMTFNQGLGISVRIESLVHDPDAHPNFRYMFAYAGANFVKK
jgi:hypothetical protein